MTRGRCPGVWHGCINGRWEGPGRAGKGRYWLFVDRGKSSTASTWKDVYAFKHSKRMMEPVSSPSAVALVRRSYSLSQLSSPDPCTSMTGNLVEDRRNCPTLQAEVAGRNFNSTLGSLGLHSHSSWQRVDSETLDFFCTQVVCQCAMGCCDNTKGSRIYSNISKPTLRTGTLLIKRINFKSGRVLNTGLSIGTDDNSQYSCTIWDVELGPGYSSQTLPVVQLLWVTMNEKSTSVTAWDGEIQHLRSR